MESKNKRKHKTCFISGKFNVVHPGHLRLFRHAKEIADELVVGVYADDYRLAGDILLAETERREGVGANLWVDSVIPVRDIKETILKLKPDVVLKGKEHEGRTNLETEVIEEYGGLLKFAGGGPWLSSSALIQAEASSSENIFLNADRFLERHKISLDSLADSIKMLANIRVTVVGDLILDRYVDCEPLGLSSEDPTVVVSPLATKTFVGGAGIVAAHAARLGLQASLVSIRGDDDAGERAMNQLRQQDVDARVLVDPDRPTTQKTRYRASGKTLLRVNDVRDHQIDQNLSQKILENVNESLSESDLIIFSDFSYGLFSDDLVVEITRHGKERGIVMAADSQSSSQMGDITRFSGMTLLTPTEREARLAVRDNKSGLVGVSERLRQVTEAQYIPITLASEGVFLHRPEEEGSGWTDDQVPALNVNPIDVSGAGDAFLVATSLSLSAGVDIWRSIYVGSIASACQINRIGNVPLSREELLERIYR